MSANDEGEDTCEMSSISYKTQRKKDCEILVKCSRFIHGDNDSFHKVIFDR